MLNHVAEVNDIDVETAFSKMTEGVVKGFREHQDRMAARLVERRVRDSLLSHAPNWNEILSGNIEINYSSESILNDERQYIAGLIENNDITGLISRYPARETPALEAVARCLGFQSQEAYEQAVRKMLCDSEESRSNMLNLVEAVTNTVGNAR